MKACISRNISIKKRLMLIVAFACFVIIAFAGFSTLWLNDLGSNGLEMKQLSELVLENLKTNKVIGDIKRLTNTFMVKGDKATLNEIKGLLDKLNGSLVSDDQRKIKKFQEELEILATRMSSLESNKQAIFEYQKVILDNISKSMSLCGGNQECLSTVSKISNIGSVLLYGNIEDKTISDINSLINDITKELGTALKNMDGDIKKTIINLRDSFYDLDDASSTIFAIRKTVIEKQADVLKHLDVIEKNIMAGSISASEATSSLAVKGEKLATRGAIIMLAVSCVAFVFLNILGVSLVRSITNPVDQVKQLFAVMVTGDLRGRMSELGRDELAQVAKMLNEFLESISSLVGQVKISVNNTDNSAIELEKVARAMFDNSNHAVMSAAEAVQHIGRVAASMTETSSMMDNLNQATNEISSNIAKTASLADRLDSQMENTQSTIMELDKEAKNIYEIIAMINDIASQTNLLALNATIEAARAGESGKGFAVVANEVKELAKETTRATERVSSVVNRIQSGIEQSVKSITDSAEATGLLKDASQTVAAAIEQQTATYANINQQVQVVDDSLQAVKEKVSLLSDVAGQNLDTSNSLTNKAEDLKKASQDLIQQVSGLQV